jgi:hypothetical protein
MAYTTTTSIRASTLNMTESRRLTNESRAARLEFDLTTYYALLDIALSQARLILSPNEAKGLLAGFHSGSISILDFDMMKSTVIKRLQDVVALEQIDKSMNFNIEKLSKKVQELDTIVCIALIDWIQQVQGRGEDYDSAVKIFKGI